MDEKSYFIPKPCENGHVFIWSSHTTIDTVAPKGVRCQCGMYKADGKGGADPIPGKQEGEKE